MTDLIHVHDDVLEDPDGFRQRAVAQRFQTVHDDVVVFHGMAACPDPAVAMFLVSQYPKLRPTLSFFRRSPEGQEQAHWIHEDRSVGRATALYYMNPHPPEGDGTNFFRNRRTGAIASTQPYGSEAWLDEARAWGDLDQWELDTHIPGRYNRLVVFDSARYHSRAMFDNYGAVETDTARLLHVIFSDGEL